MSTKFTGQDILLQAIKDGLKGDAHSFELRIRKFVNKMKAEYPHFAREVGSLVSDLGLLRSSYSKEHVLPSPVEPDTRQQLLIEKFPVNLNRTPSWPENTQRKVDRFLRERHRVEELLNEQLLPSRSLLMSGPPGTGKTLTASWVAKELNLPLLTLDLANVMSSYLGKTGNNIKSVLNYASSFPCVLLLDEFDAIAKKRDDETDVGELKRLVTVLLQSIDDWPLSSILVAATNHGELLDPAIWRRFDCVIEFDYPDREQVKEYVMSWEVSEVVADWISTGVTNTSLAIIEKRLLEAKKDVILEGRSIVLSLKDSLCLSGLPNDPDIRREVAYELHEKGWANIKIADELGITRQRVASLLKEKTELNRQELQGKLNYG
ncbi:AAA family ATPase [Pseudoalteromonas fuliginea]|uniref:AAA family ATPase n=1 Tax=Pseudoalteromonas fuliginea TaxID=1872678 RepID=A0ABQ6RLL4_9GAMM|nr:AAA family ATPase [Pseudoalteromonas fuliginea]KAA1163376.1 AAA family ATPase [Pseudoalteromonas fuliginea]KAA1168661.1 AAA family ATPase [Pseudoalteromonas fuliginea]